MRRTPHARAAIRAVLAAAALASLAGPTPAPAHTSGDPTDAELTEVLGESWERTRDGLFRVRIPGGGSLTTHGPDPRSEMDQLDLDGALHSAGQQRQPVCATDNFQHVLYAHLSVAPDLVAAQTPVIRDSIRRMNALLNADAIASGGVSADYKVLCDATGDIRVDSFATPGISFEEVVGAAKAAGFDDPRADYTIFLEAPAPFCGVGTYQRDTELSADNRSNSGGDYGLVYQLCWLDETPAHENAHNQGAVQFDSPNSTGSGGHCYEAEDVMCYSPDGGDRFQSGESLRCPERIHYDCGYDDYFDAAPEPGEYLANHWNLGSALNRYIAFGQGEQLDPPCARRECAIPLGVDSPWRSGIAPAPGHWAFYRVDLAKRSRKLTVALDGPDCARRARRCATELDLGVRSRKLPTAKRADCHSKLTGADESCVVKRPRRGVWYLGVRAVRSEPGASFAIGAVAAGHAGRR